MFLSKRNSDLVELMDSPTINPSKLKRTYQSFRIINTLLSFWKTIYKHEIKPFLDFNGVNRIADVGCGDGFLLHQVGIWAENDGYRLQLIGFEPDVRAMDAVNFRHKIEFKNEFLHQNSQKFDIVISNHVLHHLPEIELHSFFDEIDAHCLKKAIVCDVERSLPAFILYPAVGIWFSFYTLALTDGLRSIQRSFKLNELQTLIPRSWKCTSPYPFRIMVTKTKFRPVYE